MARWVPDDRDDLDKVIQTLIGMFDDAQQRLLKALAGQARAGLAAGQGPLEALRLDELRRDTAAIVRALREAYPDEIERIITVAGEYGIDAALAEMADMADVTDPTTTARLAGAASAQQMTADLTNALDDVTMRILRYPDDIYRRTIGRTAVQVPLGQATTRQVQQAAWNDLLDHGVIGFRDKGGRNWQLSSYVEMASRSATRRAYDDAKVSQMRAQGIDLVSIVVGRGSCQDCAKWGGKVLRTDSGPTGRIDVDAVNSDDTVTVRVEATLDEAKRDGWRHPNCRCSTVAYLPGLSIVADVTTYDPKAEADRMKLRALERRVRAEKQRAAASTTDDDRKAHEAKAREYQAKIRDHIAATGLKRQRNREQVNLGNTRL